MIMTIGSGLRFNADFLDNLTNYAVLVDYMAHIIKSPFKFANAKKLPQIFLAGSIDMGAAVDWQSQIETLLAPYDVVIYNPRRDDWDTSWKQSIDNPPFFEQVTWELFHLEKSDLVLFYFDPSGPAPVTLMELGLFAATGESIVCCPEGYWRKGNVDIVCQRYGVRTVDTIEDMIALAEDFCIGFGK